ncbi:MULTISPECIES: SDR family NAD(P)-dependent oxidoreductase [unclassified Sphingobium]|uniref:SDR family NAD(P)-dependent oxidoreductase n=1 Tax=unclassified Sphingobium TaxID=2611147 RepID=UPI000D17623C|nr:MULTISPECIES: SDR family oxidoreductase [unclassified Sphingobium]MBG6120005.1 3-oxoacyl-[acyl-carrier protein] reductase [Sphingobium sp. JAI105]PSO12934.1 tropine dehydrogenase [Sphingobium sp. AEW4]TWD05794.1 3-oxoacyl-[acyl-carrier protein] reductase [Sphingobium sp. AEW010]TWD23347.1 3-oxoacyl-[acyl-carrier protein] reductase [Sphingobium sp. AEW013]TWD25207.1 3-oxoacyl-[acyl-carrier protein] reductase [Sphingobium sp. AEW001]
MTGLLAGRTALITGAGTGIGSALATIFAREGANIVTMARSRDVQEATAEAIRSAGGKAVTVQGDVTSMVDVQAAVAAADDAFGGVGIAIQVAAHGRSNRPIDLATLDLAEWDAQSAVTLRGCYNLARACHPLLARSGHGRYIAITSNYGLSGDGSNPIYAAVKGALRGFAKSLAKEWGDDGITVNLFSPASMSESTKTYFEIHPEAWEGFRPTIPLRRMGDPYVDIAPGVLAIAGDQFQYMSGQTVCLDGGNYTAL